MDRARRQATPVGARAIVTIAARRGQRAHQTALSSTTDPIIHIIRMHKQRFLHSTILLMCMQAIPVRLLHADLFMHIDIHVLQSILFSSS